MRFLDESKLPYFQKSGRGYLPPPPPAHTPRGSATVSQILMIQILVKSRKIKVCFQSFCNHDIFVKLILPIFRVLVRRREISQKYFDLLVVKQILIHSSHPVLLMLSVFKKTGLFSGSPGTINTRYATKN